MNDKQFRTYYIYRNKPVKSKSVSMDANEAACDEASIAVRRIDKPEETAWAGDQWGQFKMDGDEVIAQRTEESEHAGFDRFLKDNGYEIIPEKEEEPK